MSKLQDVVYPKNIVIYERQAAARYPTGQYARIVDIYADQAAIDSGIAPDEFGGGSTLVNTETRETWLLSEHADGTKEWSPDPS